MSKKAFDRIAAGLREATTRYPRVIERDGRVVGVEVVENVAISWRRDGDHWIVQIGTPGNGVEVRDITVAEAGDLVETVVH